jgi:hypothetical protein
MEGKKRQTPRREGISEWAKDISTTFLCELYESAFRAVCTRNVQNLCERPAI